jgi:hypothetical protein
MISIHRVLCVVALATGLNGAMSASVVTYSSRTSFNSGAPGLAVEGFEAANVADFDLVSCPSPINSASNNGCFSPGGILTGLELNNGGIDQGGAEFAVLGAGFFGNATKMAMLNFGDDVLNLDFGPGVLAAGFDLYSLLYPDAFDIEVFGVNGSLGTFSAAPAFSGGFFGVVSDSEVITRIRIASSVGDFEGVDDVAFGNPVPEPGAASLCFAGIAGIWAMHRRARRKQNR